MTGRPLRAGFVTCAVVVASFPLQGCAIGYYWQAATGHLALMRKRQPVAEVLENPATDPAVRARLRAAGQALAFAHAELGLPDNGSYRFYADTGRASVVWNVIAAPEFSLEPRTWCFPIAGCVSYRGYFDEAKARRFAARLAAAGDDVFVGGVAAYSTLGRFEDPLLNTMLGYEDYQLAGLIFHELAHQLVYVRDDTTFNESFASFVEQEGLRRWLVSRADQEQLRRFRRALTRRGEVLALIGEYRERLAELYAGDAPDELRRSAKAAILAELPAAYRRLRSAWEVPPHFDHWFEAPLNNARLAAFATYDEYVPAFRVLLDEAGGDLQAFYARVEELARLDADTRRGRLAAAREAGCAPASANLQ